MLATAGASILGGLATLWIFEVAAAGTPFLYDDLTYHATSSAWWIQQATLSLPPFTYQGYYPQNAELMNLWFMLPLRGDSHANLSVLLWLALSVSSLLAIAHTFAGSRALAFFAAAGLMASPEIRFFSGSFSAGDLAATSFGLAALAFAHFEPTDDERTRFGKALLGGLAAGAAVGTKASMLAPVALLVAWWCWRALSRPGAGIVRRELVVFAVGLIVTGGYWYTRNWALAGNPLFPAEIGPFDGPFDRASQWQTSLASHMSPHWGTRRFWSSFVRPQFYWPLPLGQVAALGYGFALGAFLLWRKRVPAALRPYALLLAAVGLLAFVLFSFQPFSGTINRPVAPLNIRVRYLSFAFALGLTLYGSVGPRKPAWAALVALLPAYGIYVALRNIDGREAGLIAVGAVVTALAFAAWRRWPAAFAGRPARAAAYGALGMAVVGLALWSPARARLTEENLYSFRVGRRPRTTPAWGALEQLPAGSRVAGISFNPTSHAFYYPLFGRSFQLHVVPITFEGHRRPPLHAPAESSRGWWWEFEERRHPAPLELLANLRRAGVDYLFVSRWPRRSIYAGWPPARDVIAKSLPDRRIFGDDHSEIWDLRKPTDFGSVPEREPIAPR
ncbi:MAG: hypothetical protein JRG90_13700 [Deltaproteobacteria bacterium]|nr:hypothetical protein [Deltaproteobacteria bacterium]